MIVFEVIGAKWVPLQGKVPEEMREKFEVWLSVQYLSEVRRLINMQRRKARHGILLQEEKLEERRFKRIRIVDLAWRRWKRIPKEIVKIYLTKPNLVEDADGQDFWKTTELLRRALFLYPFCHLGDGRKIVKKYPNLKLIARRYEYSAICTHRRKPGYVFRRAFRDLRSRQGDLYKQYVEELEERRRENEHRKVRRSAVSEALRSVPASVFW